MYPENAVKVTKGQPKVYASSEHGRRHFCADCGTGLFYTNANILPGIIDIQSGTYDDPDAVPATVHIQTAERLRWMERAHELPAFDRYPPQGVAARRRKSHLLGRRDRDSTFVPRASAPTDEKSCASRRACDFSTRGEDDAQLCAAAPT